MLLGLRTEFDIHLTTNSSPTSPQSVRNYWNSPSMDGILLSRTPTMCLYRWLILFGMEVCQPSPGGLLSPKSYVDVPAEPQKSDFLYTNVSLNYPLISIPFSIEKHPILPKLGAFYNDLLKIHPIFEFGLFRLC